MKTAINILKNSVLPQLEKDKQYSKSKDTTEFWVQFTRSFLDFESDSKPTYTLIYSLELADAEKIITKLAQYYADFLKELAENYVLGMPSEASDYLISKNNKTFLEQVQFYKTLQNVVKKVERKRIKENLPKSYERLIFELSETDIANATKKKGREDLKAKMKSWDEAIEAEKPVFAKETKVILLSWMKYAVAACVVLGVGILYFKTNSNTTSIDNNIVITDTIKKQKKNTTNDLPAPVLAAIEIHTQTNSVLEPSDLGFSPSKIPKITIQFMDASKRIASLERDLTDRTNKQDITFLKNKTELNDLLSSKNNYIFDGKTLTIYQNPKKCKVLQTENKEYYLKLGNDFLFLKHTQKPVAFEKVTDAKTIETLEKTVYDNE